MVEEAKGGRCTGGSQRRQLWRHPLRQYVGLGSAERVTQLVVLWPKSGREQVFTEVPVNSIIRVTEGRGQLEILALPSFKFAVEHPKRAEHIYTNNTGRFTSKARARLHRDDV